MIISISYEVLLIVYLTVFNRLVNAETPFLKITADMESEKRSPDGKCVLTSNDIFHSHKNTNPANYSVIDKTITSSISLSTLFLTTTATSREVGLNQSDSSEDGTESDIVPEKVLGLEEEIVDSSLGDIDDAVSKYGSSTFNRSEEIAISLNSSNETIEDECHFLSFEEWKKQKAIEVSNNQAKKLNNESNVKGETSNEIVPAIRSDKFISIDNEKSKEEDQGKTYKNRFNYASIDCAATIVKINSHAKGASAILVENKDSYLLNECSLPNKFVVIELCQDILVDSIVIGNFEFFSSIFKDIRVSVSDRFPSTNWKVLGEFEAQNIRDIQTFKIENPLIWARYLKIEILSHYGNEFYCPISLVRVHGKTMMEEFKEEESSLVDKADEDLTSRLNLTRTSNATEFEEDLTEECRITLPHLGLNEFLKEINSTSNDYCDANFGEPEATQTAEIKTIQESIYKNIMKRLSLLESNASLSLLYIEEQSKLLSNAFTNLERRQTNRFETLIKTFNSSMTSQLLNFKNSYLILQNEYSRLFKAQELSYKNILDESNDKLIFLSNELRFQKRISVFNSIMIICLLIYVILTRDAYIEHDAENTNIRVRHSNKPLRHSVGLVNKFKKHQVSKKNTNSKHKKK